MVQCKYFLIVFAVPGKCGGYNIGKPTLVRFSVVRGGAKSKVVSIRLSPQSGAYTRALKNEKSLSPSNPIGGGAVDTNDWCISLNYTSTMYSHNMYHVIVVYQIKYCLTLFCQRRLLSSVGNSYKQFGPRSDLKSDVIMLCRLSLYLGTSDEIFLKIKMRNLMVRRNQFMTM